MTPTTCLHTQAHARPQNRTEPHLDGGPCASDEWRLLCLKARKHAGSQVSHIVLQLGPLCLCDELQTAMQRQASGGVQAGQVCQVGVAAEPGEARNERHCLGVGEGPAQGTVWQSTHML